MPSTPFKVHEIASAAHGERRPEFGRPIYWTMVVPDANVSIDTFVEWRPARAFGVIRSCAFQETAMKLRLLVGTCLGFFSITLAAPANSAPIASPVVLVASASGVENYGETVILALPLEEGGHFGFVLNLPTEATVGDLFPDEDASRDVTSRVDIGGPVYTSALFALVVDPASDIDGLRRVTPRFSVALASDAVDRVIAEHPDNTRFFVGLIAWAPGDLNEQVEAGAWSVRAPDTGIVLSAQPATLWQRLSRGSAQRVAVSARERALPRG
jgi:putative transcriptional regulator